MIFWAQMDYINKPESPMTIWVTYGIIALVFLLVFIFRDTLSQWKEQIKSSIRKQMYMSFFGKNGSHGTEIHEDGFFSSLAKFLDDGFLAPSEAGVDDTYDYLMEDFKGMANADDNATDDGMDESTRISTNHLDKLLREIEEDAEDTDEEDNNEEDEDDDEESEDDMD